jgi:heat shock protein HslJ
MRTTHKLVTAFLVSSAGLSGCSLARTGMGVAAQEPAAFGDSAWSAISVRGTMTAAAAPIHLHFDGAGKIAGFSGCSAFSADYLSHGLSLEISRIRPEGAPENTPENTKVCARDISAQEARLFEAPSRVRWIKREEDGTLLLRTGRGKVPLRLVADTKLQDPPVRR